MKVAVLRYSSSVYIQLTLKWYLILDVQELIGIILGLFPVTVKEL